MLRRTAEPNTTSKYTHFSGTRKDLIRGLRALMANPFPGSRIAGQSTRRSCPIMLSCSRESWVRALGEEDIVIDYCDGSGDTVFHTWQYHCADGVVLCVGHRHEGPAGDPWITLTALYFL